MKAQDLRRYARFLVYAEQCEDDATVDTLLALLKRKATVQDWDIIQRHLLAAMPNASDTEIVESPTEQDNCYNKG